MRYVSLLILLFILTCFAVGSSYSENGGEIEEIFPIFDNASLQIKNFTLEKGEEPLAKGILSIVDEYIDFVVVASMEVAKFGIYFGAENPEYFEPDFIIKIIRLIIWLVIIALLIKPISYLVVLFIFLCLWINEKRKKKCVKQEESEVKNG